MRYFKNFPIVEYNNKYMRNIVANARLLTDVLEKYEVFYPYTVRDRQRADYVAYKYYGDPNYTWLIYLANGIIDPYYQWPLGEQDFNRTISLKHGLSLNQIKQTIDHYVFQGEEGNTAEEIARVTWKMSPTTFNAMDPEDRIGWVPVYLYDVEYDANEAKRYIRLLSNKYLLQVTTEMSKIFG